jgi:hypothetical protein
VVDRTVRLVVLPTNVHTEVDGIEVTPMSGTVPIVGPLGTTHHVRLSSAGREKLADVVIAEDGVVPALVDLGPAPPRSVTPPQRASTPPVAAAPAPKPAGEPKKTSLQMDIR